MGKYYTTNIFKLFILNLYYYNFKIFNKFTNLTATIVTKFLFKDKFKIFKQ